MVTGNVFRILFTNMVGIPCVEFFVFSNNNFLIAMFADNLFGCSDNHKIARASLLNSAEPRMYQPLPSARPYRASRIVHIPREYIHARHTVYRRIGLDVSRLFNSVALRSVTRYGFKVPEKTSPFSHRAYLSPHLSATAAAMTSKIVSPKFRR